MYWEKPSLEAGLQRRESQLSLSARDPFCPPRFSHHQRQVPDEGNQRGEKETDWGFLAAAFEVTTATPDIFSRVWLGSVRKSL